MDEKILGKAVRIFGRTFQKGPQKVIGFIAQAGFGIQGLIAGLDVAQMALSLRREGSQRIQLPVIACAYYPPIPQRFGGIGV